MLGDRTNAYKNILALSKPFRNIKNELEIINLGSTIAYHDFDYSITNTRGANLALPPQTLYYDFQILKKYSQYLKKDSVVCICMFFFSFMVYNYSKDRYYYKYYNILEPNSIIGYSEMKRNIWNHAPALLMPDLFKRMIKDVPVQSENDCNEVVNTDREDKCRAGKWMNSWKVQFGWENHYTITEDQKAVMQSVEAVLKQMLDFCIYNSFRPVLVIPPISKNLKKLLPEFLVKQCFWDRLYNIQGVDFQLLDFMQREELCQVENFKDAFCLNNRGKNIFNHQLMHELGI